MPFPPEVARTGKVQDPFLIRRYILISPYSFFRLFLPAYSHLKFPGFSSIDGEFSAEAKLFQLAPEGDAVESEDASGF